MHNNIVDKNIIGASKIQNKNLYQKLSIRVLRVITLQEAIEKSLILQ